MTRTRPRKQRTRNVGLVRTLSLIRLFEGRGRWTLAQLSTRFHVTTRTVRRDLRLIEDVGYALMRSTNDRVGSRDKTEWWLL